MTTYAVTGATGGLGSAAVNALIDRGVSADEVIALVRHESKADPLRAAGVAVRIADYDRPETLGPALDGVDKLLLVSGPEVGKRTRQHTAVIEAAQAAGVQLIAYTSILGADTSPLILAEEHRDTEKALAESGVDHVLLRNGWYSENYAQSAPGAIDTGVFYGAAGAGVVAPAARSDFADAAAAALISAPAGSIYELVGAEHLSYPDIAATFGTLSGNDVRYENLSADEYTAALVQAGVPEAFAAVLANSDVGASEGALDSDSTDLQDLRGKAGVSFADAVAAAIG